MSTSEWLLLGIVTFILIDFAAARVIDFLNESNKNIALTGVAAEIYNPDEYAKSLEYGTAKYKVELFTSVISTVVMLSAMDLYPRRIQTRRRANFGGFTSNPGLKGVKARICLA